MNIYNEKEIDEIIINFLKVKNEEYKSQGLIPTIDLLLEDEYGIKENNINQLKLEDKNEQ